MYPFATRTARTRPARSWSKLLLFAGFALTPAFSTELGAQRAIETSARSPEALSDGLRFQTIEGFGGVPLNVVEAGDPSKPAILLIHGIGQSYLSFEPQLRSPQLARNFHLVAFDLRAHGNSGKPWTADAYQDTAIWAEDVARVISATRIVRPVVVAWSYGTLVVADYLRHRGTSELGGIMLVGGLGGLAPTPSMDSGVRERIRQSRERQESPDITQNIEAARSVAGALVAKPMPSEWVERTMMVASMLPAYARTLLWLRNVDNVDVAPKLRDIALMIVAGGKDRGVPVNDARALVASLPNATLSLYAGVGHSPFAEDPVRFNAELARFAARVAVAKQPTRQARH